MKKFATTALAAIVAAGTLGSGVASAQSWRGGNERDVRRAERHVQQERRDLREARRDLREARRDYRQANRWRRGDRLPSYERAHYRQVDWRRSHLRQPPRGYHYVRDDRSGEYLLVGIATGVILSILLSN
jgi:Ni/Co efflux regulator RcnB